MEELKNKFFNVLLTYCKAKSKSIAKKDIFDIFYKLEIDDMAQLGFISYFLDKTNQMIYKLLICFNQNSSNFRLEQIF